MSETWFDARGCLSHDGMTVLQGVVPGAAPAELASHVAGCARCQQRVLAVESVPRPSAGKPRDPKAVWRNLLLLGAALLLLLLGMVVTVVLVG
jgi:hypothetical protein